MQRRRPDHHRRQQRPVPQARRGARRARAGRRPAVRPQRGPHRQPRRAPAAAGRAAADPHRDGVVRRRSSPPACRAARSTPSTAASRSPRSIGLDPVVRRRRGRRGRPVGAQPDHVLRDAGALRPAAARRSTSTAPRSAPGWRRRPMSDRCSFPTSLGTSTADEIRLLGQDLTADLMGKVGFGELAFWLVALRRPDAVRRSGSSRRCWSRWPTTASPRPRSPPGSPTSPRPTRCRARWPPACSAAARASSASPRTAAPTCTRSSTTRTRLPTDDAGWDALALDAVRRTREAGRFVPGLGHPVHKVQDPRTPVLIADRRGGGPARPAPAAVRGDRPRARAGARPPAAAQRRRRLRRRPGRPRPAGRAAARLRPAGPGGRAARPDRRGAPPPDRHGRLPRRRPQRGLRRPRPTD